MASINNPLGKISGKVGDFIYRQRNGKTIVCMRPQSYKISNTQKSVDNRNKFKLTVQFSSSINKNPILKEIWKNTDYKKQRASYNIILQHFSPYIMDDDIMKDVNIFPGFGGINIEPNNLKFGENSINVLINPIDEAKDYSDYGKIPKYLQMVGIIKCDFPFDCIKESRIIFTFSSDTYNFKFGEEILFTLNIDGGRKETLDTYSSKRIIFGFVVLDEKKKIITYSSSFDETIDEIPYDKTF